MRVDLARGAATAHGAGDDPAEDDLVRSAACVRHPVDWFVRRAGLARFTTIMCALGLAVSAVTGARPTVALLGLTIAVLGAIAGIGLMRARGDSRVGARGDSRRATRDPAPGTARRVSGLLVVSVLLIGLFGGYLLGNVRVSALAAGVLRSYVGSTVRAELVVTGEVRSHGGWQSAVAVVRSLDGGTDAYPPGVGEKVLLEIAPSRTGPTNAAAVEETSATTLSRAPTLTQGLIVSCTAAVRAPTGPSDSGYDEARHLLHQGIEAVFQVKDGASLDVIGYRGGLARWFDRLRASARAHLSLGPDPRVDETLKGLVLGDTSGFDKEWLEAFRRSGTAHMFAVSGLHVGSIAAIMIGLARLLRAARWVGFLLAASSALLMIPFVGASPSIVRAAAMIVIVVAGRWVGRGRDQWQVLALAAVVILGLNPYALFDVGFQLSFGAFTGILALMAPLQRLLSRLPAAIGSSVAVSVAATLGTAPVSLAVFGRMSLASPLANLLVIPLLPAAMGLGLASVFLGFLWTGISEVLDTLASLPLMWTVLVSRAFAAVPVLDATDLGQALFALSVGVLMLPAALALTGRSVRVPLGLPLPWFRRSTAWLRKRRPRSRCRAAALGAGLVLLGLVLGGGMYPAAVRGVEGLETLAGRSAWPGSTEIRILDVGQGSATLVRTSGHHALLFDGGPAGCDLSGQLHDLGVRKLDLVMVSHPHADHFAGLLESLEGLEVKMLVDQVRILPPSAADRPGPDSSGISSSSEAADYLALRRELAGDRCCYALASSGQSMAVDDVVVRFFAPRTPLALVDGPEPWALRGHAPSGEELNGASLVAVISVGEIDALIPGDAEAAVLQAYGLPPVELLVVPHHGSEGAVSGRLLDKSEAEVAVVSVGKDNSFGHPAAATMAALEEAVGTVLRTDTSGWVCCAVHADAMVITTERTPAR